jgi:uncharacterized protein YoxC
MSILTNLFRKKHDGIDERTCRMVLQAILREQDRQAQQNEERFLQIMATQAELAQALKDATALIKSIGDAVTASVTEIQKVGAETDALIQKVKDLTDAINAGGAVSQDVTDALAALQAQVATVQTAQTDAAAALQAVDDKVPDSPPPTT